MLQAMLTRPQRTMSVACLKPCIDMLACHGTRGHNNKRSSVVSGLTGVEPKVPVVAGQPAWRRGFAAWL
jgi:hypothetical protein